MTTGTPSQPDSGDQRPMRHLLISASYEGAPIAPSSIFAALRDLLEQRGAEPIEGKCWTSPTFIQPQTASVWDAWWNLTDPERSMIHDLFPQLNAALYLLHEATSDNPLHKRPVGGQTDLDASVVQSDKKLRTSLPRMAGKSEPRLTLEQSEELLGEGDEQLAPPPGNHNIQTETHISAEDKSGRTVHTGSLSECDNAVCQIVAEQYSKHYYQASNGVVVEVE